MFKVNYKRARPRRKRWNVFSTARIDRILMFSYYAVSPELYKYLIIRSINQHMGAFKAFILAMECSLYMVLWRYKFYLTPFFSKKAIKAGLVLINDAAEHNIYRIVRVGDVISFAVKPIFTLRLLWNMRKVKLRDTLFIINFKFLKLICVSRRFKFKRMRRHFRIYKQATLIGNLHWF